MAAIEKVWDDQDARDALTDAAGTLAEDESEGEPGSRAPGFPWLCLHQPGGSPQGAAHMGQPTSACGRQTARVQTHAIR